MKAFSLNDKSCEKTRARLDAYISNELLIETNHDLLKHLDSCKDCSRVLQARLKLKDHLKHAANSEPVPDGLRDRIQAAIRAEDSTGKRRNRWQRWPSAAAAVLLFSLSAVGALRFWKSRRPASQLESTAHNLTLSEQVAAVLKIGISDHIHCVIESHSNQVLLTSEEIAQEMGPSFEGLVPAVRAELPKGFFISVGHRCDVNDREFVHLILKHDNKLASVLITERYGITFPVAGPRVSSIKAGGTVLHQDRLQSLEAVGFQTKDHLAFVVSSLEHAENMEIATRLAPTVSRFLEQL